MLESKDIQIALFRYGIISDFVNQVKLPYGEQEELIKYKCSHTWNIPNTKRTKIHRSTILSWIKRYKDGGRRIEALYPHEKSDKNKSRVIDQTTANNIFWLVKNSEVRTVNQVQQEMNHRKLISSGTNLKFQTLYRFLHHNNLMTYLKSRKKYSDKRSDNTEKNRFWLRSLVQGKIRLEELIEDFSPQIPCEDIKLLYDSILNNPLRKRNRAVTILAFYKGISCKTITEYLFISKSAQLRNYNLFQSEGIAPFIIWIQQDKLAAGRYPKSNESI